MNETAFLPLTNKFTRKAFVGLVEIWHSYAPSSKGRTSRMEKMNLPESSKAFADILSSEAKVTPPTAKMWTSRCLTQETRLAPKLRT